MAFSYAKARARDNSSKKLVLVCSMYALCILAFTGLSCVTALGTDKANNKNDKDDTIPYARFLDSFEKVRELMKRNDEKFNRSCYNVHFW